MLDESSPDTGPTCRGSEISGTSRPESACPGDTTPWTSSAAATPAKRTADSGSRRDAPSPASAGSSSGLLRSFARGLFSGRTRPRPAPTLPGLGGDSGPSCDGWDTRCCPSDSGPVALASTTDGSGCSCSPRFPTPTASSHNRVRSVQSLISRRERQKGLGRNGNGFGLNLGQHCAIHGIPFTVELLESLMGFPPGWMGDISGDTATPSLPLWPSGSADGS
jgi:hypothetical protein